MKLSQLAERLTTIEGTITKAQTEIVAEIKTLKDELADADLSPEAEASLTRLEKLAGDLDALNPDADTGTGTAALPPPTGGG